MRLGYWRALLAIADFPLVSSSSTVAELKGKDCFGATPKPVCETRALPGIREHARAYSPRRRRNCARPYSRLSFEMKLALISAGHTASHS